MAWCKASLRLRRLPPRPHFKMSAVTLAPYFQTMDFPGKILSPMRQFQSFMKLEITLTYPYSSRNWPAASPIYEFWKLNLENTPRETMFWKLSYCQMDRLSAQKHILTSKNFVSGQEKKSKIPNIQHVTLDVSDDPLEQGFEGPVTSLLQEYHPCDLKHRYKSQKYQETSPPSWPFVFAGIWSNF